MKAIRWLLFENIQKYTYMMSEDEKRNYQKKKIKTSLLALVYIPIMFLEHDFSQLKYVPVGMLILYKLPYFLLMMRHAQGCNDVVSAIPLWMNQIYALIEKNTIHNAIVNSLHEHTPKAIRQDLEHFIHCIEQRPDDKEAYLQFLSRYDIDGFLDIMLKLYEFRNLSKDKLKYEIRSLNQNLSKIETIKRQNQFRNEMFIGDTCTCFIIFIPCVYMTVISLMPSLFSV